VVVVALGLVVVVVGFVVVVGGGAVVVVVESQNGSDVGLSCGIVLDGSTVSTHCGGSVCAAAGVVNGVPAASRAVAGASTTAATTRPARRRARRPLRRSPLSPVCRHFGMNSADRLSSSTL